MDASEQLRKAHIKHIMSLTSACGLRACRDLLAGRYGHAEIGDLTLSEATHLREWVERAYRGRTTDPTPAIRRRRSKCLTLINKLGIYVDNDDWTAVNRFLINLRGVGQLLYMMDADELDVLEKRLYGMLHKAAKGLDAKTANRIAAAASARRSPDSLDDELIDQAEPMSPPTIVVAYPHINSGVVN